MKPSSRRASKVALVVAPCIGLRIHASGRTFTSNEPLDRVLSRISLVEGSIIDSRKIHKSAPNYGVPENGIGMHGGCLHAGNKHAA